MIPYKTVISITARLLNRIPTSIHVGQSIASGLRKLVKREIKSAKSRYYYDLISDRAKGDSSRLWKAASCFSCSFLSTLYIVFAHIFISRYPSFYCI